MTILPSTYDRRFHEWLRQLADRHEWSDDLVQWAWARWEAGEWYAGWETNSLRTVTDALAARN